MGRWIPKASDVFGRKPRDVASPFQLICECGDEHSGLRREQYQHLVCKSCGASLFVMPIDPYPPPHHTLTAPAAQQPLPEPIALPEEPTEETPELLSSHSPRPRSTKSKADKKQQRAAKRHRAKQTRKLSPSQRPVTEVPEDSFLEKLTHAVEQFFSKLPSLLWPASPQGRIASLSVIALLSLGMVLASQQFAHRRYALIATEKSASAMQAVGNQNWTQARTELESAVAALNKLKRNDPESHQLRQLHKETLAITRLSPHSPFDLVEQARFSPNEKWDRSQQPASSQQADWLVMDAIVEYTPRSDPELEGTFPGYSIMIPAGLTKDGRGIEIQADFPDFDAIFQNQDRSRAIFAGSYLDCDLSTELDRWIIRLDPKTGFLWGNNETFQSLGIAGTASNNGEVSAEDVLNNQKSVLFSIDPKS